MSVLTSEPFNPMLSQQLHDTLARAVELTETFEAQNRLPIHASSRLRRDEAVGNAASVFSTASVAIVGALDHLTTWNQIVAWDLKRFPLPVFSALHTGSRGLRARPPDVVAARPRSQ
jgi:hypothetical protein